MKTILIPTDFNENSVLLSKDILGNFNDERIRLIFFHAYKLTDSISDLLMLSRRTAEYGKIPEAFHRACYEFKKEHSQTISAIGIEYFYGSTMAAFRNFAEANDIDFIFYPQEYNFKKISKYSLDPQVFLVKSGIPALKPMPVKIESAEQKLSSSLPNTVTEMA